MWYEDDSCIGAYGFAANRLNLAYTLDGAGPATEICNRALDTEPQYAAAPPTDMRLTEGWWQCLEGAPTATHTSAAPATDTATATATGIATAAETATATDTATATNTATATATATDTATATASATLRPLLPPDSLEHVSGYTVRWDPVLRARGYRLELYDDEGVGIAQVTTSSARRTEYTFEDIDAVLVYRVRIRTLGDGLFTEPQSDWSDFLRVDLRPTPMPTATLIPLQTPDNLAHVAGFTVRWDAVPGATRLSP